MTFDDINDNKMGWKHLLHWVGKAYSETYCSRFFKFKLYDRDLILKDGKFHATHGHGRRSPYH